MRRIPERCYLCGEPTTDEWFCPAHQWADARTTQPGHHNGNGNAKHLGKYHAYWVERFTPDEVLEIAGYITEDEA